MSRHRISARRVGAYLIAGALGLTMATIALAYMWVMNLLLWVAMEE